MAKKVAVVGAGVSGISAAYHVKKHGPAGTEVVIIEARHKLGGHAWTFGSEDKTVGSLPAGTPPIDCGFMVCNHVTYPNLMRFFDKMKVALDETDMGFGITENGATWSFGANPAAWARMVLKPRFWRLIYNLHRFHREALAYLQAADVRGANQADEAIGDWLQQRHYDEALVNGWILPFCAAVWSKPLASARKMHARSLFLFMRNHGFLSWSAAQWYTPRGRCQSSYLPRVREWFAENGVEVQLDTKVAKAEHVQGGEKIRLLSAKGDAIGEFDDVVFATNSGLLNDVVAAVRPEWTSFLAGFRSSTNRVVIHGDESIMPKERHWWTSWMVEGGTLSYWLNNLQGIPGPSVFETLNPPADRKLSKVYADFDMVHPVMDGQTIVSQEAYQQQAAISSSGYNDGITNNRGAADAGVWLAGAYLHHGFHEDGFRSGIEAARALLRDESIPLHPVPYARFHPLHHQYRGTTTHVRGVQVRRTFRYPLNQSYVAVEGNNQHWWGGLQREDHFGDPSVPMGETVRNKVCEETGVFPTGSIDFLGNLRTYGYSFNPICFFFVWEGEGERDKLAFVVSEVTNTPWGQTAVHVLDVRDEPGKPMVREKSLHVSPFNGVPDGKQVWQYSFHSLPPSNRIHLSVTLFEDGKALAAKTPTIVAIMDVARTSKAAPRLPLPSSLMVQLQIHWQAILLLIAGMKFVPNTTCPMGRSPPRFIETTLACTTLGFALVGYLAGFTALLSTLVAVLSIAAFVVKPLQSVAGK